MFTFSIQHIKRNQKVFRKYYSGADKYISALETKLMLLRFEDKMYGK